MSALRIVTTAAAAAVIAAALLLVEAPSPPYADGYYVVDVSGSYLTAVVPDKVDGYGYECAMSHPAGLPAVFITPGWDAVNALVLERPPYVERLYVNGTLYAVSPTKIVYGIDPTLTAYVAVSIYANKYEKTIIGRVVYYDSYKYDLYVEGRVGYVYVVDPSEGAGEPILFTGRCRLYYAPWKAPLLQRKIDIYR